MRLIATILAIGGLAGLTLTALAIVVDVLLRFFFNSPMTGLWDVAGLISAVSIAAFFPLSFISGSHISIRAFGSMIGERWERSLDIFAAAVTLGLLGLMTWQFARLAGQLLESNESTPILHMRTTGFWFAVAVLLAVAVAAQLYVMWRTFKGGERV